MFDHQIYTTPFYLSVQFMLIKTILFLSKVLGYRVSNIKILDYFLWKTYYGIIIYLYIYLLNQYNVETC